MRRFMSYLLRRPALTVAASALLLAVLLFLRALEGLWPPLAWWAFVLLSLTLGFGHGALDALLLLGRYKPVSQALLVSTAYLACVLLAGWVLSWFIPVALLTLILMSVWHFGELHSATVWMRICVGGASVMWPQLVARNAMAQLLQEAFGPGFEQVWRLWHVLAMGWLFLVTVTALCWFVRRLVVRKKLGRSSQGLTSSSNFTAPWAAIEVATVLCAYLVVSPLLAFALYFGLYHCLAHVARVRRAVAMHSALAFTRYATVFLASAVATALLLLVLWQFLPAVAWFDGASHARAMQWLVVSLAAVTLPHLLLISASARWLGR
jgi:beta-carotene 15,15'-dioxygenase